MANAIIRVAVYFQDFPPLRRTIRLGEVKTSDRDSSPVKDLAEKALMRSLRASLMEA